MNEYGMIPPPTPRKRHRIRNTFLVICAAIVGIIIITAVASSGGGTNNPSTAPATDTATATAPATTAAPAATGPSKVCFAVVGTGQPSISYGSDSDSRDAGGTSGAMSDGNPLPWRACMPANRDALFWNVTAQLQGGGHITATVTEVRSDGTRKVLDTAHASGGYQIANAEYVGYVGP